MPRNDHPPLPDGREWNGLAYVHSKPVAGCTCGSCKGWFPKQSSEKAEVDNAA